MNRSLKETTMGPADPLTTAAFEFGDEFDDKEFGDSAFN
jgi:hypothetical protein